MTQEAWEAEEPGQDRDKKAKMQIVTVARLHSRMDMWPELAYS